MNCRSFPLVPFPGRATPKEVKIAGAIGRHNSQLSITYVLLGPLSKLAVPLSSKVPSRRKSLWKETCFEFFIATGDSPHYWEFNLSPSGHWNVYRFLSYRQGMQEEPAFDSLPLALKERPHALELSLLVDLGRIIRAGQTLRVGVAAVIKTAGGRRSYWALTHHGPDPDFHLRDSFLIKI
jgi:hypothetical protein